MNVSEQILFYRQKAQLSVEELARLLDERIENVLAWESGSFLPRLEQLDDIANALHVTAADLCTTSLAQQHGWEQHDRMFSEKNMYRNVENYARELGLVQTEKALPYALEKHEGQFRKGRDHVPYINHPLQMACHALALGLTEDDLIAAILLHDVCEDCRDEAGERISPEDLPVGEVVQEAVRLVTKPENRKDGWSEQDYYLAISENRLAVLVKILDRCNNISMMATGFTKDRMASYIDETEEYVFPLLDKMKKEFPECYNAAFLVKYQILSILGSMKRLL